MTLTITYRRKRYQWKFNTPLDKAGQAMWEEIHREEVEQEIRESILDECIGWEAAGEKEYKEFKRIKINWKNK